MYNRDRLLVKVATMYYQDEETQTNISKKLGISRPTVASILREAKDKNIVRIIISHPNKQILEKQDVLQEFYPNTNILIASSMNEAEEAKKSVGNIAAQLLEDLIENASSIGIGWGTTLAEVINSINYTNNSHISIYPLIGGVVFSDIKYHANHLTYELAKKTNGKANYLYAPVITDSKVMRDSFIESEMIKSVLDNSRNVDIALVGIGNPIVNSNYGQHGYLKKEEIDLLKDNKIVGDMLTSFYDSNGTIMRCGISERMIGLAINDLLKIKNVIAVATGKEKVLSAKVMLEKNILNYFVLDEALADELIDILEQENSKKELNNDNK